VVADPSHWVQGGEQPRQVAVLLKDPAGHVARHDEPRRNVPAGQAVHVVADPEQAAQEDVAHGEQVVPLTKVPAAHEETH